MTLKWTMRLTPAGMLPGGVYVTVVFIAPARGTVDANERVTPLVSQKK
ncbi:hypothetical protein PMI07_004916 [Rhizobium sp. CF080]|nr:hypothetical protein PMI07_004916 [Rhizobium sp. CF080]